MKTKLTICFLLVLTFALRSANLVPNQSQPKLLNPDEKKSELNVQEKPAAATATAAPAEAHEATDLTPPPAPRKASSVPLPDPSVAVVAAAPTPHAQAAQAHDLRAPAQLQPKQLNQIGMKSPAQNAQEKRAAQKAAAATALTPAPQDVQQEDPHAQADSHRADPAVDTSFPAVLADHRWQKAYDVSIGNTILIRRSTEEPDPAGKTILFRWRSPSEMRKNTLVSSKPNTYDLRSKMREKQFENR